MVNDEFCNPSVSEIINNKELEEIINKYGSLLSIIVNKPISCVTMFLLVVHNKQLQDVLLDSSDASWYTMVEYLAYRYPLLNKSKKVK